MNTTEIVRQAERLGTVFTITPEGRLFAELPDNLPQDLKNSLRASGKDILLHIKERERVTDYDLPFPIGYGNLPVDLVLKAEGELDREGVTDPYYRKMGVINKLLNHYYSTNDQSWITYLTATYHKFRHNDPDPNNICGMCRDSEVR